MNFINNEKFGHFYLKADFFFLASLWKFWQSIYSYIYFTLALFNLKIVLGELLSPINLSGAQAFYIYKMAKIIIIHKNKNFIFAIFEVVLLCFENFNNSQKFINVGFILNFYRNHFFKKKYYWILLAQICLSDYIIKTSSQCYLI